MDKTRPVNLNLMTIKFPITAIVSILHRASGVLIFLYLPVFMYLLQRSLSSPASFYNLRANLDGPWVSLFIWIGIVAVLYHLVAGVRHLIMDLGHGESMASARKSAMWVFIVTIILAIIMGIWIW